MEQLCLIAYESRPSHLNLGILHFSVNTFCYYRFDKARKAKPYPWINESEKTSVLSKKLNIVHLRFVFMSLAKSADFQFLLKDQFEGRLFTRRKDFSNDLGLLIFDAQVINSWFYRAPP